MSASESAFTEALTEGALTLVTTLAQDSSDVLVQLNALDLLELVRFCCYWTGVGGLLPSRKVDRRSCSAVSRRKCETCVSSHMLQSTHVANEAIRNASRQGVGSLYLKCCCAGERSIRHMNVQRKFFFLRVYVCVCTRKRSRRFVRSTVVEEGGGRLGAWTRDAERVKDELHV